MKSARTILGALVLGAMIGASPAGAQVVGDPAVVFVPRASAPTPPAGLWAACNPNPNTGAQATTCPVVKYNGNTTWAFSFNDNRMAFALVTYDPHGKIIANITKPGARYIWNIASSHNVHVLEFFGQGNGFVEATWEEISGTPVRAVRRR